MAPPNPTFPYAHLQPAPSTDNSINTTNTAKCNEVLSNYRQQDVVFALMTHLKEKEGEIKKMSQEKTMALQQKLQGDAVVRQLQSAVSSQKCLLEEKEKMISKLNGGGSASVAATEGRVKELTEELLALNAKNATTKSEFKRILKDREEKISKLKLEVCDLSTKVEVAEKKSNFRYSDELEQELDDLEAKLDEANEKQTLSTIRIDEMEKEIKRKEWIIKSLQDENEAQRHRESHLLKHIATLDESLQTYETQFNGKEVDVPMVLAKLEDATKRSVELEGKMKNLTAEYRKLDLFAARKKLECATTTRTKKLGVVNGVIVEFPQSENDANLGNPMDVDEKSLSNNSMESSSSSVLHTSTFDDDAVTLNSMDDPFSAKHNQDDISLLIQDVKNGIERIQEGAFCRTYASEKKWGRDQ